MVIPIKGITELRNFTDRAPSHRERYKKYKNQFEFILWKSRFFKKFFYPLRKHNVNAIKTTRDMIVCIWIYMVHV